MDKGCVFCDQTWMRAAEIFIETPHCIFASTRDPVIRAGAGPFSHAHLLVRLPAGEQAQPLLGR